MKIQGGTNQHRLLIFIRKHKAQAAWRKVNIKDYLNWIRRELNQSRSG